LPEGITNINFGARYNQPLVNLPSTTIKIVIQSYNEISYTYFNQLLDYLPGGVEELGIYFNQDFNYPLTNLPPKLKRLFLFGYNFYQPINNLSNNLEHIEIKQFDYQNTFKLPDNLKTIKISEKQHIINDIYNQDIQGNHIPNTQYNNIQNLKILENNNPNVKFIYKQIF